MTPNVKAWTVASASTIATNRWKKRQHVRRLHRRWMQRRRAVLFGLLKEDPK